MATSDENAKKGSWPGPSIEQEAWDHLFGDAVATGVDCVAPSMDPDTVKKVHHENVDDEVVVSGEDDASTYSVNTSYSSPSKYQENPFFQGSVNEVHQQDVSALNKTEATKQFLKSTKKSTKRKTAMMKRRRRELARDAKFMELMIQSIAVQEQILQILESRVSRVNESSYKFSVQAAIGIVNRMVDHGLMTECNELWLFAVDLLEDGVKRELFTCMPDDDSRLAWLLHMQKNSGK